jgi:hypothetical protein
MYVWFTKWLSGPLGRAFAELRLAAMDNPEHQRRLVQNIQAIRTITTDLIVGYCDKHGVELSIDSSTFALMVIATVVKARPWGHWPRAARDRRLSPFGDMTSRAAGSRRAYAT